MLLDDPSSAEFRPEEARTESSAASSIRCRMEFTDLNTPGSIGGGIAFPGLRVRNERDDDREENAPLGQSGGE